jgi:hypothetical protein
MDFVVPLDLHRFTVRQRAHDAWGMMRGRGLGQGGGQARRVIEGEPGDCPAAGR